MKSMAPISNELWGLDKYSLLMCGIKIEISVKFIFEKKKKFPFIIFH